MKNDCIPFSLNLLTTSEFFFLVFDGTLLHLSNSTEVLSLNIAPTLQECELGFQFKKTKACSKGVYDMNAMRDTVDVS